MIFLYCSDIDNYMNPPFNSFKNTPKLIILSHECIYPIQAIIEIIDN